MRRLRTSRSRDRKRPFARGWRWFTVAVGLVVLGPSGGCGEKKMAAMSAFQGSKIIRPTIAFEIMRDNPELVVLDLRSEGAFSGPLGHISRALNVPLTALPDYLRQSGLPTDRALLVYCDRTACCQQGQVILTEHGFRYVFQIDNGIEAWIAAGFGTVGQTVPPAGG